MAQRLPYPSERTAKLRKKACFLLSGNDPLDAAGNVKIWSQAHHPSCSISVKWSWLVKEPEFSLSSLVHRGGSWGGFSGRASSFSAMMWNLFSLGRKKNLHPTYLLLTKTIPILTPL